MADIILDNRMTCIAECVPYGAVLADIGTDHGKLPVYLVKTGKINRAVAADINEMPLQKAVNNINKYGLQNSIDTFLTDGLHGIERFSPDCVVIAGMGGELIAQILDESTLANDGIKYILQPMTKEDVLSKYLCGNGYTITDEHIVNEGKLYRIICAVHSGENIKMTEAEHALGRKNIEKGGELFAALAEKVIKRTETKLLGKQKAMLDTTEEESLLYDLSNILANNKTKKEGEIL